MLLAASDVKDKKIVLVSALESKPGDVVKLEGKDNNKDQIKIEQFFELKMLVKDKNVTVDGEVLKTEKEVLSVDGEDGWRVR
jgi:hypothetical protein